MPRPSSTGRADLEVAARRIAWGKFLNAGQTCIAPDYVLVDETVQDELIEQHRATAVRAFYGDGPDGQRRLRPASSTSATSTA